jgi:hypothetical protein
VRPHLEHREFQRLAQAGRLNAYGAVRRFQAKPRPSILGTRPCVPKQVKHRLLFLVRQRGAGVRRFLLFVLGFISIFIFIFIVVDCRGPGNVADAATGERQFKTHASACALEESVP